jgi:integrase/recombinase XerD
MTTKAMTVTRPAPLAVNVDVLSLIADWHSALDLAVNAGELAALTRTAYIRGFEKFVSWWTVHGGGELVTSDTIRQWKADLLKEGRPPATVNAWLAGVRAFFAWGVGAHRLAFNPTEGVKTATRKGTNKRHKRETLTNGEIKRVLAAPNVGSIAGRRDKAILALMVYTAARTIEIQRADLVDLRTEGNKLVLAVQGKGRTEKDEILVIAHQEARDAVYDWLAERGRQPGPFFTSLSNRNQRGRLSLSAIRALVKRYYHAAGVVGDNKTTHSLRHSAITNAVKHGLPVQGARILARHASLDTTLIYYHETDRIENPAEAFIDYSEE